MNRKRIETIGKAIKYRRGLIEKLPPLIAEIVDWMDEAGIWVAVGETLKIVRDGNDVYVVGIPPIDPMQIKLFEYDDMQEPGPEDSEEN